MAAMPPMPFSTPWTYSSLGELKNDRLLRAIRGEPLDRTPVWFMRQAGRYLPEYRATRAKAGDFITLMSTPELATEVTLQPLERFPLDAAILFSDILTVPDAMGLGLYFVEGEGPKFSRPLRDDQACRALATPDISNRLDYVYRAVSSIKKELAGRVPLIGFCGSPWTLLTYMVEGGASKDYINTKQLIFNRPELAGEVLGKVTRALIDYLSNQIQAGADTVMVFDSWGGVLSKPAYLQFSLAYMQKIVTALHERHPTTPVTLFTKGGGHWLAELADTGCNMVGLDWQTDIASARELIGDRVALQGNMDPTLLYAEPQIIRAEVGRILQGYGQGSGHVFNLGHGITPGVPPEHVSAMVEAVQQLSPQYHG